MWIYAAVAVTLVGSTTVVEVRDATRVDSDVIYLRDVADINGPPAVVKHLGALDVSEFEGSKSTLISRQLVALRIQIDGGSSAIQVRGAARCRAERVQARPFPERVTGELREQYAKQLRMKLDDVRVKLQHSIRPPENDALSKVQLQLADNPRLGTQRVSIQMTSRGGERLSQSLLCLVEAKIPMPVLTRNIQRGDLIQFTDYRWEPRFLDDLTHVLLKKDLEGRTVGSMIPAGTLLKHTHLLDPIAVKLVTPRQRVYCLAKIGGLKVSMPDAIALTAGARGQSIRLKNPKSNREFTGVVFSAEEVHVILE